MSKFLIDANLPRRLKFWLEDSCEFVPDPQWADHLVWQYAKENNLIIVTKDADFERLALTVGPPVVIHLRVGGRSRKELWQLLEQWWPTARDASQQPGCRLVRIFPDCVDVV
jgi:predicted nuclease of predicted toxin-antitoxin system